MIFDQTFSDRKVRVFSLSASFLGQFKGQQPKWGFGGLGYFTFKRTYARPVCDCEDTTVCGHSTEEWWQTCQRVVEGVYNIQKIHCRRLHLAWSATKAQNSAQEMFQRMWDFKFLPPGRGLWMMGTDVVLERGAAALNNCGFASTESLDIDFAGPFTFLMDMSMLGVGVGGDTRGAGKVKIQVPKTTDDPYEVHDSREGWVALIQTLLNSFVGKGKFPLSIDFSKVRKRGAPLKTSGGVSSGPKPLIELVQNITSLLLPEGAEATFNDWDADEVAGPVVDVIFTGGAEFSRITSTQIVDVFNYIGKAVVAGGIRRSAEIMFGEPDDHDFVTLKQDKEALMDRRWASNNSIWGTVGMNYDSVAESIAKNGEPGIIWMENARAFSRMDGFADWKDERAKGANPCFAGETLIAVADGRGAVPIKQLVDEGCDVPVYSVDPEGKVEIKMARNPRQTRDEASLVEVVLEDGTSFRVTPDHGMRLLDGSKCEAKDLQAGDSLPRLTKRAEALSKGRKYLRMYCNTLDSRADKIFEHRLIARFQDPQRWNDLYDEAKQSGWVKGGLVVHHKDFNPLNNRPDNLEIMTFQDHCSLHGKDHQGEKNPMWGREHSAESKLKIGRKTKERCSDPLFLAKLAASHTEAERQESAARMSKQRQAELLSYYKDQDARTDLDTVWLDGRLYAVKDCEACDEEFVMPWGKRGRCYCSLSCGNKKESSIRARKKGQALAFANKQRQTLHSQVMQYKDLEESLGRTPWKKEWESACRDSQVSFRFRDQGSTKNPHALFGWKHLKEVADGYNHRVKEVRFLDAVEPVYNLTVDDHHTVGIITKYEKGQCSGVFTFQCVEQTLEDRELCCLVETFPAHHDDLADYQKTLKMAYLYAKTVTLVPTHDQKTNTVLMRNRRIGCSMSGIQQAKAKMGRRAFLGWCGDGYEYIQSLDKQYSEWLCIPRSIKTTSVKPSGTVSLLAGATPGIHYPHSEFYIRNIRVKNTSPLVEAAQSAGYIVEPDAYADDTAVISFPVQESNFSKGKRDVSIWEQFADAAAMQKHWADNQVSNTVTFAADEAHHIARCLEVYEDQLKAISMLPLDDHGYVQAPYIEITGDEYATMTARLKPLDLSGTSHDDDATEKFCDSAGCEVDFTKP